jgi:hypothetical protein
MQLLNIPASHCCLTSLLNACGATLCEFQFNDVTFPTLNSKTVHNISLCEPRDSQVTSYGMNAVVKNSSFALRPN